jgi:hypothetical protein
LDQIVVEAHEEALALESVGMWKNGKEFRDTCVFGHWRYDEFTRIIVAWTTRASVFVEDVTIITPKVDSRSEHAHEVISTIFRISSDAEDLVLTYIGHATGNREHQKYKCV